MPNSLSTARPNDQPESEHPEAGQAAISLILILGLFLFAILGFAVDLTNIWFHRQAARAAADAACQAGAMDLLVGSASSASGFTAGTGSNCVSNPKASICTYAKANGYNGSGIVNNAVSNSVSWTFPSSVAGVSSTGSSFLRVSIAENIRTYFTSLLSSGNVQLLNMSCTCGVVQVKAAAPMMILDPSASGSLTYSGGAGIVIAGGPARSIQVNSSSSTAIKWSASGMINLSAGGPNGTGSNFAVVGGPAAAPGSGTCNSNAGFCPGSTGIWKGGVTPVADPFAAVPVPASVKSLVPAHGTGGLKVAYGTDGCPDSGNGCYEFSPGYYPSGLVFPNNYMTMIFDPGIYYLNGSLNSGGSNTLRMANPAGTKQTDGIMFYFYSGTFNISGGQGSVNAVSTTALTCDGSSPPASLGMPSTINGNVLWGQCTANGTYTDAGGDTTDTESSTGSRGILIYQAHANSGTTALSGSGQLSFGGSIYLHSTTGTSDVFNLSGGTSTGTFILGQIVADKISLTGSGAIRLALNPTPSVDMSKVAILQ